MAATSGVVEAVTAKEMPEDKFGNTFRRAFKLEGNDQWFSVGGGKRDAINLKDGAGWHTLGKGDEIEFMYDQNGDFANVKTSKISVISKGNGSVPSNSGATRATNTPPSKPNGKGVPFEAGIKVGHAINNAVQLAVSQGKTDVETIKTFAIEILQLSKSLEENYNTLLRGEVSEKPLPKKTSAVKDKEPVTVADFDDECPF